MSTNVTLKQVAISNVGTVKESERPLWVGTSKVTDAINGRLVTMSITNDGTWLWVRFSNKPSEKYKEKLVSYGFTWSIKRGGWHININEAVCKLLNDWGAWTIEYRSIVNLPPTRVNPPADIRGNLDLDPPVRDAIKNKEAKEKQASKTKKQSQTNELATVMAALTAELANLRQEVKQLKQASYQVPTVATKQVAEEAPSILMYG